MLDEQVERFRSRVEDHFGGPAGRGDRYPEDLRLETVAIARRALARGESRAGVARILGIRDATLSRWLESSPEVAAELRPVELIEPAQSRSGRSDSTAGLVLVTAGGHRVEGLSVDEAAVLLAALR